MSDSAISHEGQRVLGEFFGGDSRALLSGNDLLDAVAALVRDIENISDRKGHTYLREFRNRCAYTTIDLRGGVSDVCKKSKGRLLVSRGRGFSRRISKERKL